MRDVVVRIAAVERVEMQTILLDKDKDAALAFVKRLCDRIEANEKANVRSPLDR